MQVWMTDGYGNKALMDGAETRDRWKPLGWYEAEEPAGDDRVWMRHQDHGGRAQFPAGVMGLWQQKGWQPSDPPAPASPFNAATVADTADAAPADNIAPAPAGKTTAKAKEK
ncbi:hypothetical protein [Micromonospora globbae]|uniref:hypothetical protein n=1 Tax=Micromonospora globbae TaxID=1894969 RepID=UPI00342B5271